MAHGPQREAPIAGLHQFERFAREAAQYQSKWRKRNELNFSFYDGDQWSNEDLEILEARKQQATVLNVIRPTIDIIMSLEAQQRTDLQIVPREKTDIETADILTEALKQVYDSNDYNYFQAQALREGLIGGIGWLEVGIEKDENDETQITVNKIPWEEVFWDPFMRRPDGSDARYIIRRIWMDLDIAKKKWPDKADELQSQFRDFDAQLDLDFKGQEEAAQSIVNAFYVHPQTRRVGINETWYMDNEEVVRYVVFHGSVFLEGSEEGKNESPFNFNIYPLIPYIASRNRDGEPIGVAQIVRSIQETINKINSKYLWTISSRRVIVEADAIEDPEEIRDEMAKPDSLIVVNPGVLTAGKIKVDTDFSESQLLMQMLQFQIQMSQRVSGVNDALQGIGGINARTASQESSRIIQGAAVQSSLIENLYFTKRQVAKVIMKLMGQFYTESRVIRITQPNGDFEFRKLNEPFQSEETGEKFILNNIEDILRFDVVLREVAPFNTIRQLTLSMFSEVFKAGIFPPEVASEIFVELSDIPNKERHLKNLQGLNKRFGIDQQLQARGFPTNGGAPAAAPV